MRRWLLAAVVLFAAAVAVLQDAPPVAAHALLARADPPINAALRESPSAVSVFMTEPLQRDYSSVRVLDSSGERRDIGDTEFSEANATQMRVNVLRLPPGVYTVVWRTLSQVDGHTWNGSYVFSVLNPDGSAPAGAGLVVDLGRSGPPPAADAAAKAVSFAALVLFVGAVAFWLAAGTLPTPRPRLVESTVAPALAIAVGLGLLTTGYEAISAALELGGIGLLDEVLLDTRLGLWLNTRWAALLLAAVVRRSTCAGAGARLGVALARGACGRLAGFDGWRLARGRAGFRWDLGSAVRRGPPRGGGGLDGDAGATDRGALARAPPCR